MTSLHLTELDMIIRLVISFIAGAIIGFERSSKHQVAGLRTHILICEGATLLMLLSIWLPQEFSALKNGDPGRIAAQVVSGIGFLGAGAILRLGNNVRGLTTAGSLWFAAALGLAIGGGMFIAALVAEVLGLSTLWLLGKLERRLFPAQRNKTLVIFYKEANPDTKKTLEILGTFGIKMLAMDVNQASKDNGTKLKLLVALPTSTDYNKLAKALKSAIPIKRFEIKENF
ncbi:MgtC/SapB family protein [Treponema sp. TIM-1]|uniref:MgtC/SapB family protein n=1 Tax=Treponema sp. TIM-1 TaxID=2898417 RepID=UPI00397FDD8F